MRCIAQVCEGLRCRSSSVICMGSVIIQQQKENRTPNIPIRGRTHRRKHMRDNRPFLWIGVVAVMCLVAFKSMVAAPPAQQAASTTGEQSLVRRWIEQGFN